MLGFFFFILPKLQLDAAVQVTVYAAIAFKATAAGAGDWVNFYLAACGIKLQR